MSRSFSDFASWLDNILEGELPADGVAVNFNLYDEEDGSFSMQMIISGIYDPEDDDWAAEELFTTGEDVFVFEEDESEWLKAQETAIDLIGNYLREGLHKDLLLKYRAVCTGFIDGDLMLLNSNEDR